MKNVLLLVHDDAGQEARLQVALDLTRALGGHLTCLDVVVMPEFVADYDAGAAAALLLENARAQEAEHRDRVAARLAKEDVPYDWRGATGDLASTVRTAAALADIVVVNRELESATEPDMLRIAGELVVKSGKPVLAVPEGVGRLDVSRAVIAWDGSAAAEAAVRAATPLLAVAESVVIVQISDGSVRQEATEAAAYLSRHGIKPEVRFLPSDKHSVEAVLIDTVRNENAGYLVMGGFGHSRLIEAVFGGVTRDLLRESPVPLLLAH